MGVTHIILLVLVLVYIASWWIVFEKAGQRGWLALIPVINIIIVLKIAGKPIWWIILLLIPYVNIIFGFLVARSFTGRFGDKSFWAAIGLMLVSFVYIPLLAFDKEAAYIKPIDHYPKG